MNTLAIEAVSLYWPILAALILGFVFQISRREGLGLLYAILWNLATLPVLNGVAESLDWWTFNTTSPRFGGLPLSLWFGWAALWGGVACILSKKWPLWVVVLIAAVVDSLAMPLLDPLLVLHPGWIAGEVLLLLGALLPALYLFRWTAQETHLALRATLIAIGFTLLALVHIALAAHQGNWQNLGYALASRPPAALAIFTPLALAALIPLLLALREFVVVGKGTPVPMDAPKNLVTSGIYRWIRNPMQFGFTAFLIIEALLLSSPWLLLASLSILVYSLGFARWSEEADMQTRFGQDWLDYRKRVPAWRFRLR